MDEKQATVVYLELFDAFPLVESWVNQLPRPKETMAVWRRVLASVDVDDAKAVVQKFIAGDLDLPAAYDRDRLPQLIKREANDLRSQRRSKQNQFEKYHKQLERIRDNDGKFAFAHRESIRLGELVQAGKLNRSENDRRVDVLCEWAFRAGPEPEWITEGNGGQGATNLHHPCETNR